MDAFLSSDIGVWCSTFWEKSRPIEWRDLTDGVYLNYVFCEIAHYDWKEIQPRLNDHTANTRLQNWKLLIKNMQEFYLDQLEYLIVMSPPSIFHIVHNPSSKAAVVELEKAILLLLLAAIKCEHRDEFIRSIVEKLNTDVQRGIMQCITGLTENPEKTLCLSGFNSITTELQLTIARALKNREELYFKLAEEVILRIFDQHPNWTPTKGRLSNQEQRPKRCLSMASALDVIGDAFNEAPQQTSRSSPQHSDVLTSGFHSRLPSRFSDRQSSTEGVNILDAEDKCIFDDRFSSVLEGKQLDAFLRATIEDENMDPDKRLLIDFAQESKSILRKQRMQISEQADQLTEVQSELREARAESEVLREERCRLADAAIAARHWRDEADAGRQAVTQVEQLERTCEKLRQRLDAAQYYKIRCQELTEEISAVKNEYDDLMKRISKEAISKTQLIDEQITAQSQRVVNLELQREKDLEEISCLRKELMEAQLDMIVSARKMDICDEVSSQCNSDLDEELALQKELFAVPSIHKLSSPIPSSTDMAPYDGKENWNTGVEAYKELEDLINMFASRIEEIRRQFKVDMTGEHVQIDGSGFADFPPKHVSKTFLCAKLDSFFQDLEQLTRDVNTLQQREIDRTKEFESLKLILVSAKPEQIDKAIQTIAQSTNLTPIESLKLEQSLGFAQKMMTSTQSSLQQSRVLLCDVLSDSLRHDLETHQLLISTQTAPADKRSSFTQTTRTIVFDVDVQTQQTNQSRSGGTPIRMSIVQPNRKKATSPLRHLNVDVYPMRKPTVDKTVNTVETRESMQEAASQTEDTRHRLVTLTREHQTALKEAQAIKADLEHCTAFLEEYEHRNTYLEKENRTLLLQLRSLLSQNQGVLMDALDNNECHYREKLALRDELTMLKRHKERLEEKIFEQYKTLPSHKKGRNSLNLIQKARTAFQKRKDVFVNCDVVKDSPSEILSSLETVRFISNLQPGSVSVFDRDPDERNLDDFTQFLTTLDQAPFKHVHTVESAKLRAKVLSTEAVAAAKVRGISTFQNPSQSPAPSTHLSPELHVNQLQSRPTPSNISRINSESSGMSFSSQLSNGSRYLPTTDRGEDENTGTRVVSAGGARWKTTPVDHIVSPSSSSQDDFIFFPRSRRHSEFIESRSESLSIELRPVKDISNSRNKQPISETPKQRFTASISGSSSSPNSCQTSTSLGGLTSGRRIFSTVTHTPFKSIPIKISDRSFEHALSPADPSDTPDESIAQLEQDEILAKPVVFLEYGDL